MTVLTHVGFTNQEVPLPLRLISLGRPDMCERNIADVHKRRDISWWDSVLVGTVHNVPSVFRGNVKGGEGGDLLLRWSVDHSG